MSVAFPESLADRLSDLGNIPLSRIVMQPALGSATIADWVRLRQTEKRLCELVDGTLVEKTIGWRESLLAMLLGRWLGNFVDQNKSGVMTGPDGFTRIFSDLIRGPDVAYVAWDRMPGGRLPTAAVPENHVPESKPC